MSAPATLKHLIRFNTAVANFPADPPEIIYQRGELTVALAWARPEQDRAIIVTANRPLDNSSSLNVRGSMASEDFNIYPDGEGKAFIDNFVGDGLDANVQLEIEVPA